MNRIYRNSLLSAFAISMLLACGGSSKKNQFIGNWVSANGKGYKDDTLKITLVEDNLYLDKGGMTLTGDYVEAGNRVDVELSGAGFPRAAKMSFTYINQDDALWMTGGVNGKRIFKRADKK